MKKLGFTGLALILSLGINSTAPPIYNLHWYVIDDRKIPKEVDTPKEIEDWVWDSKNIRWVPSHENSSLLPQNTLNKEEGDCLEKALLELASYYIRCGKKGRLIIGEMKTAGKEKQYHAEVDYCGVTFYDPKIFTPIRTYEFDEIAFASFSGEEAAFRESK